MAGEKKGKAGTGNLNAHDPNYEKPGTPDGSVASEASVSSMQKSQQPASTSRGASGEAGNGGNQ